MKLIVSFGGGVNSAAMLVGLHERGITPDAILFADTGGEKPETYQFVHEITERFGSDGYLDARFPPVVFVSNDGMYKSLERECLEQNTLPSIVFGWRSCSDKYKLRPQQKWAKQNFPGEDIRWAVGIDAGEKHRMGKFENCWHPLVEWNWDRGACVAALRRAHLPVPQKSACFFCPASTKADVLRLRVEWPDLFDRSVAMERNATKAHTAKGLGRHWSWDSLVRADEAQFKMFPEAVQTPCMCFDGEPEELGEAANQVNA